MSSYSIEEELNMLDPKTVQVYKDEFNKLKAKIGDNKEDLEVEVNMGFPLTNPDQFISFSSIIDGKKEKEIGILENIKDLDSKSRKILKAELKRAYFMPQVTRINRLKENHGVMKFDVETEKGQQFVMSSYFSNLSGNLKQDIKKISANSRGGV